MTRRARRTHSPAFKAKVALAAVRGEKTLAVLAKRMVRPKMVRKGITYEMLTDRLAALGVHNTPVNMRNKIARGRFTATFML